MKKYVGMYKLPLLDKLNPINTNFKNDDTCQNIVPLIDTYFIKSLLIFTLFCYFYYLVCF